MRYLALAFALLVICPPTKTEPEAKPPAAEAATTATSLRVGAWNIEWLGTPDSRTGPAHGVAQEPGDLADEIAASGVAVLALEEVTYNADVDGHPGNETLREALELLGPSWRHRLFPKFSPGQKTQWTGLAWDESRAKPVGEPFEVPVKREVVPGGGQMFDRSPWAMKFQAGEGKTDLVLIPIHLKSNRNGTARGIAQRTAEAHALAEALGAVREKFGDQDVVVLGDTNIVRADEDTEEELTSPKLHDLGGGGPTTWKGAASFDRIYVPALQPEFKGSSLAVHGYSFNPIEREDHKVKLSDHYLVYADVLVMDDDD